MAAIECAAVDLVLTAKKEDGTFLANDSIAHVGDIVVVELDARSEGAAMSGVRAVLTYDWNVLQYVGYDSSLKRGMAWYLVAEPPWGGLRAGSIMGNVAVFSSTGIPVGPDQPTLLFRFRFKAIAAPSEGKRPTRISIIDGLGPRARTKRVDQHGFKPPMPGTLGNVSFEVGDASLSLERDVLRATLVFLDAEDSREALLIERINELLAEGE